VEGFVTGYGNPEWAACHAPATSTAAAVQVHSRRSRRSSNSLQTHAHLRQLEPATRTVLSERLRCSRRCWTRVRGWWASCRWTSWCAPCKRAGAGQAIAAGPACCPSSPMKGHTQCMQQANAGGRLRSSLGPCTPSLVGLLDVAFE